MTSYTVYTRDSRGLPTRIETTDALTSPTVDRWTTTKYDTSENMFAIQHTDALGHTLQSAYEPGLGVLAAQADVNGTLTTFQYDTFGRLRADHPAAGGDRSVTYNGPSAGAPFGSIDDHRLGEHDVVST